MVVVVAVLVVDLMSELGPLVKNGLCVAVLVVDLMSELGPLVKNGLCVALLEEDHGTPNDLD
jgi:hypothetical protein